MIITSPNSFEDALGKSIFLAGGITNCPDWQGPVANRINELTNLVIFNPRRNGWDMNADLEESRKQILWEDMHLKLSDIILFWFPEETLCPITLLELGKYLMSDARLIVGTHPNYQRRFDVEVQTSLVRDIPVWDDLDAMVDDMIGAYRIGALSW